MFWSSLSWILLEMGPRDPLFVVFLCHPQTSPLCVLPGLSLARGIQGKTYSAIAQEVYPTYLGVYPCVRLSLSQKQPEKEQEVGSACFPRAFLGWGESKITFLHSSELYRVCPLVLCSNPYVHIRPHIF